MDGIDSIGLSSLLKLDSGMGRGPQGAGLPDADTCEIRDASGEVSAAGRSDEQMMQLAKDFESVLLTRLFDQVKDSIGQWDGDEEDGASQQIHGLFWYYLAHDVAGNGGFGLWQDIYRHFKDLEEAGVPGESIDRKL